MLFDHFVGSCVADEFYQLVQEMWVQEGQAISPSSFLACVWRVVPSFRGYHQQDAQEFLRYILAAVHTQLVTSAATSTSAVTTEEGADGGNNNNNNSIPSVFDFCFCSCVLDDTKRKCQQHVAQGYQRQAECRHRRLWWYTLEPSAVPQLQGLLVQGRSFPW